MTSRAPRRATRRWFARPPEDMAVALLGQRFTRVLDDGTRVSGIIVETEAYLGREDRAAHTFGGRRTPRNDAMYHAPGTLYVYFTYGMHHCMNVICGRVDEPVGVLIRALEPVEGLDSMRARRCVRWRSDKPIRSRDLCSGPGKVCQALGIDLAHNGADLARSEHLFIERTRRSAYAPGEILNTSRIGVDSAGPEWAARPLRWCLRASAHVSAHKRPVQAAASGCR